jgi:uncharacterized protein (TIGR02145 family)
MSRIYIYIIKSVTILIKPVLLTSLFLTASCEYNAEPPVAGTGWISDIRVTSAVADGYVFYESGSPVTERGICWDTISDPTIYGPRISEKGGLGKYSCTIKNLVPSTIYYARAYATNRAGTGYGKSVSFRTGGNQVSVITWQISSITHNSAVSGGNISAEVGMQITSRGVCWSTHSAPTIYDNKTIDGTATGFFASNLSGLDPGKVYFVRSYATTKDGTIYGIELSFKTYSGAVTDIDNNLYYTETIGNQEWMIDNLKVTRYRNGDLIGTTLPTTKDIRSDTYPGYQWAYEGDERIVPAMGRLYTWYTATDSRKICPDGWHLPGDEEWSVLIEYLGGESVAGGKMKDTDNYFPQTYPVKGYWLFPNIDATNESRFKAYGSGFRDPAGQFRERYYTGTWWSGTGSSATEAFNRYCSYSSGYTLKIASNKSTGYSVRCIRD